jgi:diadenosine tetraphosphate (Ap4A) HIT family hydrolase
MMTGALLRARSIGSDWIFDMAETWSLHPQIAQDTRAVVDWPLSQLRLMEDANYPWLILVPRRVGASEIIDLDAADRAQLMQEVAAASGALKVVARCDKLNVAAIGNVVPQLHVHVVARRHDDLAWPRPVWGTAPPHRYEDATREALIAALRRELRIGLAGE